MENNGNPPDSWTDSLPAFGRSAMYCANKPSLCVPCPLADTCPGATSSLPRLLEEGLLTSKILLFQSDLRAIEGLDLLFISTINSLLPCHSYLRTLEGQDLLESTINSLLPCHGYLRAV